jgi:outer membrane lipoprotein SlyB
MNKYVLIGAVFATVLAQGAYAQEMTPKQQYAAASKQAAAKYADDKKLCADESTSDARMQCLRDAKSVYNATLASAKAAMKDAQHASASPHKAQQVCEGCGRVTAVNEADKEGEGSALGLIAGGVAGAVLGHQVGNGTGQDLATIAGAAGGAYAGNKIEKRVKTTKVWNVSVDYDDGSKGSFSFDHDPGFQAGDAVKKEGDSIVRR